jgi:hypothetical protein
MHRALALSRRSALGPHGVGTRSSSAGTSGHARRGRITGHRLSPPRPRTAKHPGTGFESLLGLQTAGQRDFQDCWLRGGNRRSFLWWKTASSTDPAASAHSHPFEKYNLRAGRSQTSTRVTVGRPYRRTAQSGLVKPGDALVADRIPLGHDTSLADPRTPPAVVPDERRTTLVDAEESAYSQQRTLTARPSRQVVQCWPMVIGAMPWRSRWRAGRGPRPGPRRR